MPDAAPLEPSDPRSLGQYEVIGRLGAGGQGAVYLGRNQAGEHVAIKLLHAQYAADPSARARFTREVTAAQKVEAFCTARVIEADLHGDQPYVVSEFIDGPSLHDVVSTYGPRSPEELEKLAIGTATALAAIHEAGIVHRDFKPNNVMLASDGPRVVDFGIARTVNSQESKVTATGMVVGTPGYLAPEQLTGAPLMPSVDIFAWGAAMVFAATGQSPFDADTLPVIINRILNDEPDLSALQEPLRSVVGQCLAKDPAQRPTATQLLLQLLGNAGAAPQAGAGDALLAQGTQLAAALPAPPPLDRTAMAPPIVRPPSHTPPPMPGMGPSTPPPTGYGAPGMGGPMTPPPMQQGQMTPPPMGQAGYGQPGYGQPAYGGYGQMPPNPAYGQPTIGMGQPGMMPGAPMGMPGGQPPKKSNTGLLIGIGGGAVAVIAAIVIVIALVSSGGSSHNTASSAAPSSSSSSNGSGGGGGSSPGPGGGGGGSGGSGGGGGSNPWAGMQAGSSSYDNSYEGDWNGQISGSNGSATVQLHLYPAIGTGLLSYNIGSTTCYSKLTLFQQSSSAVALKEVWEFPDMSTYPACAVFNNTYEILSLNNGTVHYTDYHNQGDTTPIYTGDLAKAS